MSVDDKTENRNELVGYADLYLKALTAHDPSRLPVTEDVRFTENTRLMKIGEGLWKTASAIKYRHVVADPRQGQVGVFCTLQEGGEYLTLKKTVPSPFLFTRIATVWKMDCRPPTIRTWVFHCLSPVPSRSPCSPI